MKIGIIGLPNVGKSTLFKAVTRQKVDIANYPFCTIEPNIGVVPVPDERLEKLALFSHSKKTIPAVVEFVDIAGLVKGAAQGEGLGNKFLSHIREVDAIAQVVRIFDDLNITHISVKLDPVSDIEIIEYELILKDIETIARRLEQAQTDARGRKKDAEEIVALLERMRRGLGEGKLARSIIRELNKKGQEMAALLDRETHLLTAKPILYICNVSEKQIENKWKPYQKLQEKIGIASRVDISAKIESELAQMPDYEKEEFLKNLGVSENGLAKLIKTAYATLGLITFFTTGEDETRGWTIPKGSFAPRAGRAIHSDFEEKFIRAEVIAWDKLLEAGSYARARELGWLRTEGKNYTVQDGDIIEFKI